MPTCRRCGAPSPTDTAGCPRCSALGALLGGAAPSSAPPPPPPSTEVAATVAVYRPSAGWGGEILPAGAPPAPAQVQVGAPPGSRRRRSSTWAVPVVLLLAALGVVAGVFGVPRLLDMAGSSATGEGVVVPGTDLVVDIPKGWEAEALEKNAAFMGGFNAQAAGLEPKGTLYQRGDDILFVAGVSLPPGTETAGLTDPQFTRGGQFGGITVQQAKSPLGPGLEISGEMPSGPLTVAMQMTIIRHGDELVMVGAGAPDSLAGDKLETYKSVLKTLREK